MNAVKNTLLILLITNNLFIFFFGIAKFSSTAAYERELKASLNLDSGMAAAIHACEDIQDTEQKGSLKLNGSEITYDILFTDTGGFYIKVKTNIAGIMHTKEAVYFR